MQTNTASQLFSELISVETAAINKLIDNFN
jgi:hypothetical protein